MIRHGNAVGESDGPGTPVSAMRPESSSSASPACSTDITRQQVINYLRAEACRDVPEPWLPDVVPKRLREIADFLELVDR